MLHVKGARNGATVTLPAEATIDTLLERLDIRPEHRRVIAPFVNNRRVTARAALREGDHVFLALPIGGG